MSECKIRCKCCGERAEFTLQEEGRWENRYQCSNCTKSFWEDHMWLKDVKKVGKAVGFIATAVSLASGNIPAAVISITTLIKGGDDTTIG